MGAQAVLVASLATATLAQELGNCAPVSGAVLADGTTPDPCLFQCGGGNGVLHRFHLEPVLQSAGPKGYLEAVGTSGSADTYYFGPCGALKGVTCVGATTTGQAAAIQSWGGDQPPKLQGECAVLGHDQNRNCSLVPPDLLDPDAPPGMLCKYTGGSGGRSFTMAYECTPGAPMSLKAASTGVRRQLRCQRDAALAATVVGPLFSIISHLHTIPPIAPSRLRAPDPLLCCPWLSLAHRRSLMRCP